MNISLGTQWEAFISEQVRGGRYMSASELVRDGLRLLQEREELRQARLDELRTEIAKGLHDMDEGDFVEVDGDGLERLADEVKTRGRQDLSGKRSTLAP